MSNIANKCCALFHVHKLHQDTCHRCAVFWQDVDLDLLIFDTISDTDWY